MASDPITDAGRNIEEAIIREQQMGIRMPGLLASLFAAAAVADAVRQSPINTGNIVYRGEEWVPLSAWQECDAGWKAANAREIAAVAEERALIVAWLEEEAAMYLTGDRKTDRIRRRPVIG